MQIRVKWSFKDGLLAQLVQLVVALRLLRLAYGRAIGALTVTVVSAAKVGADHARVLEGSVWDCRPGDELARNI